MPPPGTSGTRLVIRCRRSDEDAGGRRAADQLVRAEEHRVDPVHRQVDVRRRGGEVPERQRAVLVEQRGQAGDVADDAGDVGGRRERADLERPVGVLLELVGEERLVDVPVGVLGTDHDVGDRLAPRQLVGVVLERPDEHDRPQVRRDVVGEAVLVLEGRGDPQAEDADQLGDRAGAARAGEDHRAVVVRPARLVHQSPRVLAQPRGLQAGAARLGVGVRVAGEHLVPDEVLEEADRAAGRRVVGVRHPSRPERPVITWSSPITDSRIRRSRGVSTGSSLSTMGRE